jgi:hypothetical protein
MEDVKEEGVGDGEELLGEEFHSNLFLRTVQSGGS